MKSYYRLLRTRLELPPCLLIKRLSIPPAMSDDSDIALTILVQVVNQNIKWALGHWQ